MLFAFCCSTYAAAQIAPGVRPAAAVRQLPRLTASPALKLPAMGVLPGTNLKNLQYIPQYHEPPFQTKAWLTRHQRLIVNAQRLVGVSKIQAIRNVRGWGAQYPRKNPRPALMKHQAFRSALAGLAVPLESMKTIPPHPFRNQRRLIYRGLALDLNEKTLRNILENGLRVKDVGPYSNTLLYSLSGPYSRTRAVRTPIINLTDNAATAAHWAHMRQTPGQICVVVAVKSVQKGDHIIYNQDIPAESIYALTALLMVDGKAKWCKVEWNEEGFLITPYEPVQP